MGCSIGGRIVLYLAHQHAKRFRAIIGLESARACRALLRRELAAPAAMCTAARSRAGVVSGLVAPTAPDNHRWETLWHYMQSGPGVFKGDLHFYKVDGDIRDKVDQIDGRTTPLYLLTGEYDYSCTSEGTLDVAKRTGAEATIMKGLGHFPMSEDPPKFISYLLPVLEKIRGAVVSSARPEETPCPTPKPFTRCSPPPARPTRSSQFAGGLRYDALSDEVRHYARRHLLDTVGVMIAGAGGDDRDPGRSRDQGGAAGRQHPGPGPRAARRPARRRLPRRHRGARHRARRRLPARLGALRLRRSSPRR